MKYYIIFGFNPGFQLEFLSQVNIDEHDNHAFHWAIKMGSKVIAAARLCTHNSLSELPDSGFFVDVAEKVKVPIATLNRLVVNPDYQRQGLSRLLDNVRFDKALELKCKSIVVVGPGYRVNSLMKIGFKIIGNANLKQAPEWLIKAMKKRSFERIIVKKDL
ncbi:MAG: GNAT family N-acetyltransferase [Ignavibacteriaceae bacterium]